MSKLVLRISNCRSRRSLTSARNLVVASRKLCSEERAASAFGALNASGLSDPTFGSTDRSPPGRAKSPGF